MSYLRGTSCRNIVFSVDMRTNSDYFTLQHLVTAFITETDWVCCAVCSAPTVYLCFYNRGGECLLRGSFCRNCALMCFVSIWEEKVIISLYRIKWLFYNRECVCSLRATIYPHCIYVFSVDMRMNSDYFTVHHEVTGFYYWKGLRLLRGTFCPLSEFMCYAWTWEQTANISLYSIDCFYNRDGVCLLRGTFCRKFVFSVDLRTNSDYFNVLH
jgi:hypothetical protein